MKILRPALLLIILLSCSLTTFAQTSKSQNLAYYDADSVLAMMNSFKAKKDSMNRFSLKFTAALVEMEAEYEAKSAALKTDSAGLTTEQYAVRQAELTVLVMNYEAFIDAAMVETLLVDSLMTVPIHTAMQLAAEKAGKKKGHKAVYTEAVARKMASEPGTNYKLVDITSLVIKELRSNGEIR